MSEEQLEQFNTLSDGIHGLLRVLDRIDDERKSVIDRIAQLRKELKEFHELL